MNDISEMTPGEVLADANVSDFIGSMGLAIAQAQTALDENSVRQIPDFAAPREGLNGRSLFDLGLSPAFYHYQHADLSVSLQLQLRVERTFGLDIGANFNFSDTDTSNSETSASSSESSSGSSSRTTHREAEVNVGVTTAGALTVNGNNFQLSGDNPLERINNLAEALRGDSNNGIERALPQARTTAVDPTCEPPSDHVVCTPNAVTFMNEGSEFAIIMIEQVPTGDETFVFKSSSPEKEVTVTPQASIQAQADEAARLIREEGYTVEIYGRGDTPAKLFFDHDDASHEPSSPPDGSTNSAKLNGVARLFIASGVPVELKGFCDRSGPRTYNKNRLAVARLDYARRELIARGVPASQIPASDITTLPANAPEQPSGPVGNEDNIGEDQAALDGAADRSHDPNMRKTEIQIGDTNARFLVIRGTPINSTQVSPDSSASGNRFVYVGSTSSNQDLTGSGRKIVVKGTDFPLNGSVNGSHAEHSPEAYAANLARDVNTNTAVGVRAWATGNVCNLANNGDRFELVLVTRESRSISLSGTEDVTVTTQFSRSSSSSVERTETGNQTVAVGASLGLRFGRQYETNITGNSSISARLVSVPAPPEFLEQIKAFLEE